MTQCELSGFFLALRGDFREGYQVGKRWLGMSFYPILQKNHNLFTAIFGFLENGSRRGLL